MKPTPAKPRIIIAHVDGSGTPDTCSVPILKGCVTLPVRSIKLTFCSLMVPTPLKPKATCDVPSTASVKVSILAPVYESMPPEADSWSSLKPMVVPNAAPVTPFEYVQEKDQELMSVAFSTQLSQSVTIEPVTVAEAGPDGLFSVPLRPKETFQLKTAALAGAW